MDIPVDLLSCWKKHPAAVVAVVVVDVVQLDECFPVQPQPLFGRLLHVVLVVRLLHVVLVVPHLPSSLVLP